MDQQNNGSSSKPHPRPSYASMAARGSPPPPSPPNTLSRITYETVFSDPTDGHLAHLPIPPMGLRPEELANTRAVAYKVPARYKVSIETFADAAVKSLSTMINLTKDPSIKKPIISAIRHPGVEFDRMELVYHESVDAFKVSTTPIIFKKTAYPPLSSTIDFTVTKIMFSEYQFHTSADAGDNLCAWVKQLLEIEKPMGKVILIQIPMRISPDGLQLANHQVFAYVKGDTTPEAVGLGRHHSLPFHQRNPIKMHWTAHGDSNFCNYCKSEGHVLGKCALRLSKTCTKCKAAGHLQPQCDRFSERDLKTAKVNESERNPSIPPCDSSPSSSTSAGAASSTSAPSPPHATAALLPPSPPKTPAAVASTSTHVAPSSAPAPFASLLKAAKAATVSSRSKGRKAIPSSTSGVAPPSPAEPLSPSTSLSPSHNAVLSPIVSPSPSPPLPFSEQEFSPTVLSLVSSPGFIPGTPENELFDVFSESQIEELSLTDFTKKNTSNKKGKEVVRNDNNKRFFHDSSANTSVTSVLQQVGTRVTQKYMKRGKDQGVHGIYVASSQASTTGGSSGYMSSPNESQVFTKQKKEGLFQSMGKSVKKTVSKIVSPSPTPTVRRSVRSRVFTQKTKPTHQ